MLKRLAAWRAMCGWIQPPSGGCVLKPERMDLWDEWEAPAAFGRLCVETSRLPCTTCWPKPAAFGRLCVETNREMARLVRGTQPPSGGCVLKHVLLLLDVAVVVQPPSGGCVLKLRHGGGIPCFSGPAAFGRLCVETMLRISQIYRCLPAAFGRLCVET